MAESKTLRVIRDGMQAKADKATAALVSAFTTADKAVNGAVVSIARAMFDLRLCFTTADGSPDFGGTSDTYRKHITEHVRTPLEVAGVTNYDSLRVMSSRYLAEHIAEMVEASKAASVKTAWAKYTTERDKAAAKRAQAERPEKAATATFAETATAAAKASRKSRKDGNPDGNPDVRGLLDSAGQALAIVDGFLTSTAWKPNAGDVKRYVALLETVAQRTEHIGTTLDGAQATLKTAGSNRSGRTGRKVTAA
jgi:hypothetical protein